MPDRRNLTEREIVNVEPVDLSTLNLTRDSGLGGAAGVLDGGGTGNEIGVPTNFRVLSQEVVDFDGEYRVHVTVEFDGVAGTQEYEARLTEVLG